MTLLSKLKLFLLVTNRSYSLHESILQVSKKNVLIFLKAYLFIQMNKLLREVPTMESWLTDGSSKFVQVNYSTLTNLANLDGFY